MKKVTVISKKYDGSLRDEYETFLYGTTDEAITLFSPPGLSYMDYRKGERLEAPDGILEIYTRHKRYNVLHIIESAGGTQLIYVNLALPPTLSEGRLEWTDLDIDYRLWADSTVEQLDVEEFAHNAQHMKYPQDLIEQVEAACREVESGLAKRSFPFDYERQADLYYQIKHLWQSIRGRS